MESCSFFSSRRRHTRLQGDWSSDVCSSDLRAGVRFVGSGFGRDMAEQPVILERRGWRVAFFALTRAWNPAPYTFHAHAGSQYIAWGDTRRIFPAIRELKASGPADLVRVSIHGRPQYRRP